MDQGHGDPPRMINRNIHAGLGTVPGGAGPMPALEHLAMTHGHHRRDPAGLERRPQHGQLAQQQQDQRPGP